MRRRGHRWDHRDTRRLQQPLAFVARHSAPTLDRGSAAPAGADWARRDSVRRSGRTPRRLPRPGALRDSAEWHEVFGCSDNKDVREFRTAITPVIADTFRLVISRSVNPVSLNAAQISEIELYPARDGSTADRGEMSLDSHHWST